MNKIPTLQRRSFSVWHRRASGAMKQKPSAAVAFPTTDIVISEFPDMPKVMDALCLLPERFNAKNALGEPLPYDITVIPPQVFSSSGGTSDKIEEVMSMAAEKGVFPLLDERSHDAPLRCVPGSYKKFHGYWYTYNKADIQCLADIVLDEEIAYSLLRYKLTMACRNVYADLVPLQRGKHKKSYKMKAIGRCCEFASLLSCGRDDFSDYKNRPAHETDRAKVLVNVRLSKANFPCELHDMYNQITRLEDIAELWRAACVDGRDFKFNFSDIDDGSASVKMDEIADIIGIDSFFDAWESGVPVEDISA